jgi:hypothetical protein
VKLLIFGGGFFILLAERGVVPKEGLWMVWQLGRDPSAYYPPYQMG